MDRFTTSDGKVVGFKGDMNTLAEALLRLSKYEDTGLLPEEVAEVQKQSKRMKEEVETLEARCDEIFSYAKEQLDCARNLKSDLRKAREMKDQVNYYAGITLAKNVLLRVAIEKAEKEILDLKKQIEGLLAKKQEASNMDRFLEDLNGAINCSEVRFTVNPVDVPNSDAKLTPKKKQKIAWEAD